MTAGSFSRTCQSSGLWSGTHPTCSRKFTNTFLLCQCSLALTIVTPSKIKCIQSNLYQAIVVTLALLGMEGEAFLGTHRDTQSQACETESTSSSSSSLEHIPERHGGRSYKKIKHIGFSVVIS